MTLGLTKQYTPSAGQLGNATSYNTDIGNLFNAFIGLENGSSTLGGLTVTPTTNSTTTLNVTNSSGTSIFSVDTTNGYPKYKTVSLVPQNITNVVLATDYSTTSGTFTTRTGASVTLTTLKASAKVLVMVRSNWSASNDASMDMSILTDSATSTYLGGCWLPTGSAIQLFSGSVLLTGLTAAAHTFEVQVKINAGLTLSNNIASLPQQYTFELIAMEI